MLHVLKSLKIHFRCSPRFYRFLNDSIKISVDCIIVNINFHFHLIVFLRLLRLILTHYQDRERKGKDNTLEVEMCLNIFGSGDLFHPDVLFITLTLCGSFAAQIPPVESRRESSSASR